MVSDEILISSLQACSVPAAADKLLGYDTSDAVERLFALDRILGLCNGTCNGRLTTESGVPVSTSDRTSQGTLYFTPYNGNCISIYDGSRWKLYSFTERSLALTMTSGKNYDVFIYDNNGALTLELSSAWTNDTTRAESLTLLDGVYVKTTNTSRRYLGTIRASGSNVTEDSGGGSTSQTGGKRFVWNMYNRVRRPISVFDGTNSWSYSTASYRQANNASGNKVEVVNGAAESLINLQVLALVNNTAALNTKVGIGEDAVNAQATGAYWAAGIPTANGFANPTAALSKTVALGYHYYAWLEYGSGSGTQTWYGDNAGPEKLGLFGNIDC